MTDRSKAYNREKNILTFIDLGISALYFYLLLGAGWVYPLANWARQVSGNAYVQFLVFSFLVGLVHTGLKLPFSLYGGYFLEHKYGLSRQTFGQWLWDGVKGFLVSTTITLPLLLALFALLQVSPQWWWFYLGVIVVVFTVVLARLAPVIIFPLFYKFTPLENTELLTRLKQLLERYGFHLEGLYQFDLSKKTVKANAAFTGMGKTRRIILGDTLLERFTPDEIEFVVAHEVGHFVYRHLFKGVVVNLVLVFVGLYFVHLAYGWVLASHHVTQLTQLEYLPYLGLFLFLFSFGTMPLANGLSRRFEFQADAFAVQAIGRPEVGIRALQKLAELNLTDTDPHPVIEFMFHSHPSIKRRIAAIQQLSGGSKNDVVFAK